MEREAAERADELEARVADLARADRDARVESSGLRAERDASAHPISKKKGCDFVLADFSQS